jgi:thioredoxin 1
MLSPIIDQIGQEQQAKVKVVKINVDESGDLAMRYNIASIPTVIFFDHGQIKTTIVGYRQKEDYLQAIDK